MRSLQVIRPGPLALVQDGGRPRYGAVGVSRSGAFDRAAFIAGARLVGNDPTRHAAIEVTLGGLVVRAGGPLVVALTGAACPATADGHPIPWDEPVILADGVVLTLVTPAAGLRSYLSVSGGIAVEPVLGSRSSDLLSGIGPPRLTAGLILLIGDSPVPLVLPVPPSIPGSHATHEHPVPAKVGVVPADSSGRAHSTGTADVATLDLLPGPRIDWLADPASLATDWLVSPASNRVGVRLTGPELVRTAARAGVELPSEPLVRGAVQLPPSGQPVIFGPDHPTTGGYPVVAVLTEASGDRLAQCRPGRTVRLAWAPNR